MPIITLTTDFGLRNGFVGVMKGVIYTITPDVKLVDISHAIPPQDIQEGAYTLWRAYSYFPHSTVHVYVVDPGVGTDRRPMAARIGNYFFVGPDNGLLTPIIEEGERKQKEIEIVHLDQPKFWLSKVSRTFHGRDIFSPVAAHLVNGVSLSKLGSAMGDPVRLNLPQPERTSTGWRAHVTGIDYFGNLTTDLPAEVLQGRTDIVFRLQGAKVRGMAESYGHRQTGELVALVDSADYIEIAVVNGSAQKKLNAKRGDVIDIIFDVE